jgi:hypothetical protein
MDVPHVKPRPECPRRGYFCEDLRQREDGLKFRVLCQSLSRTYGPVMCVLFQHKSDRARSETGCHSSEAKPLVSGLEAKSRDAGSQTLKQGSLFLLALPSVRTRLKSPLMKG